MSASPYFGAAARTLPSWHDNPFIRFFLWASKTDARLMTLCAGSTRRTHVARGFFVTATGLAAAASSYYFIYTTLGSGTAAAVVAPLCGSMIFMFDRELVGGTTIRTAWARIVLSLILGTIISIPFEMRLLESRLNQEISRAHSAENAAALQRLRDQQTEIDQRKSGYEAQLADLRRQQQEAIRNKEAEVVGRVIAGETTGIRGQGPAFRAADVRIQELQTQTAEIQAAMHTLQEDRDRVAARYKQEEIGAVYDFSTRYEAMEKFVPRFSPLWRLSWMITLVIILFDMFPVLTKVLADPTDYDVLVRAEMAEIAHRAEKLNAYNHSVIETEFLDQQPSTLDALERRAS